MATRCFKRREKGKKILSIFHNRVLLLLWYFKVAQFFKFSLHAGVSDYCCWPAVHLCFQLHHLLHLLCLQCKINHILFHHEVQLVFKIKQVLRRTDYLNGIYLGSSGDTGNCSLHSQRNVYVFIKHQLLFSCLCLTISKLLNTRT